MATDAVRRALAQVLVDASTATDLDLEVGERAALGPTLSELGTLRAPTTELGERYQALLVGARALQLRLTDLWLAELARLQRRRTATVEGLLTAAAPDLASPDLAARATATVRVRSEARAAVASAVGDATSLLEVALLELAQAACDREAAVEELLGTPRDLNLRARWTLGVVVAGADLLDPSDVEERVVEHSSLARGAVNALNTYDDDGLYLLDRVAAWERRLRDAVDEAVEAVVSWPEAAVRPWGDLVHATAAPELLRLAWLALTNCYREAHVVATVDQRYGEYRPHVRGVRWQTTDGLDSPYARPCSAHEAPDDGLGPGVYDLARVPTPHQPCGCATVTELKACPGVGLPTDREER